MAVWACGSHLVNCRAQAVASGHFKMIRYRQDGSFLIRVHGADDAMRRALASAEPDRTMPYSGVLTGGRI
jgi:predicted aminopeptidase